MIRADSYNEHGVDFPVPEGMGIRVGWLAEAIYKYNKSDVLIITRPAITPLEIKIHHRHPLFWKLEI